MVAVVAVSTKSGPNRDVNRTASQIMPIASDAHRSRSSTKIDLLTSDEGSCGIVVMSPLLLSPQASPKQDKMASAKAP